MNDKHLCASLRNLCVPCGYIRTFNRKERKGYAKYAKIRANLFNTSNPRPISR